jgi:hypothetical protein
VTSGDASGFISFTRPDDLDYFVKRPLSPGRELAKAPPLAWCGDARSGCGRSWRKGLVPERPGTGGHVETRLASRSPSVLPCALRASGIAGGPRRRGQAILAAARKATCTFLARGRRVRVTTQGSGRDRRTSCKGTPLRMGGVTSRPGSSPAARLKASPASTSIAQGGRWAGRAAAGRKIPWVDPRRAAGDRWRPGGDQPRRQWPGAGSSDPTG